MSRAPVVPGATRGDVPAAGGVPEASGSEAREAGRAADAGILRVISMGSGGFDTAVQIGSIHALLVVQGRAPDAVVGLSAGAVNAVALADVLQAGEPLPPLAGRSVDEVREAYRLRMTARVERFRRILDRLVRVPQELFEGLLPDAYQVDAREPLQTVEAPIFLEAERERRNEAVANRAGLVRLYNHLLGLGLTFGTITQIVRRGLGIAAAGEIRSTTARIAVRLVEVLRLWILAGVNLGPISRLVPFFLGPQLRSRLARLRPERASGRRSRPGLSAGAIIFRFPRLEAVGRAAGAALVFVLVLTSWVVLSLGLVLLPWLAALRVPSWLSTGQAYAVALALVAGLALPTLPKLVESDRTTYARLAYDTLKSLLVAAGLVLFWSACVCLALTVVRSLLVDSVGSDPAGALTTGFALAREQLSAMVVWGARAVALLLVVVPVLVVIVRRTSVPGAPSRRLRRFVRAILRRYRIERSIFSTYLLERLFSDLFDEAYWGRAPMRDVVADSLADRVSPWPGPGRAPSAASPKLISTYAQRDPAIQVGIAAANLDTGKLEVLDPALPVVSSLVAALAVVPFFPPRALNGRHYVDGANVTNFALQGVFELLSARGVLPEGETVHVYPVMTLPVTRRALPDDADPASGQGPEAPFSGLVDVTLRALDLQRFRDATLERRLTELYTQTLPRDATHLTVSDENGETRRFVRSWVTPLEPATPIGLNRRILQDPEQARRMMLEAVADGCRASLETLVRSSQAPGTERVACRAAVERHLAERAKQACRRGNPAVGAVARLPLPGSEPAGHGPDRTGRGGPGLGIVCRHCASARDRANGAPPGEEPPTLSFARPWRSCGPAWPHELEASPRAGLQERFSPAPDREAERTRVALRTLERTTEGAEDRWPRVPAQGPVRPLRGRPVCSLLFSGGVFRGVFQMGAIAALSELGLRPDLVAGASVGSITGAMSATVLGREDAAERRAGVASLASVYLALDRLVLTDRFADFVRNLTVRAGEARFSIRQADRVFRRFDVVGPFSYGADVRRVLAGLERLFYVSPFEVARLVEAVRDRRQTDVSGMLRDHVHEWLRRMNADAEVLGAEPLHRLIDEFVVESAGLPAQPSIDDFAARFGIRFLVTATDLQGGRLEILGVPSADPARRTPLVEALLASSAFPGVFRPRYAHEVHPGAWSGGQYIDGGTMDNLPLDAVAEFLLAAAPEEDGRPAPHALIHRRPSIGGRSVPHLVFAASLEVMPRHDGRHVGDLSWPELMKRTRQLGYNRKLDQYQRTQANLRRLYEAASESATRGLTPLDLELVVAKPRWLCGTFAFHPMLGFRRRRQAQSIAHGCASTLVAFAGKVGEDRELAGAWGIDFSRLPAAGSLQEAVADLERAGHDASAGRCWLSPAITCPFSRRATADGPLPEVTRSALHEIYRACPRSGTHGF